MNPHITSLIDYGFDKSHYDNIDDGIIYVVDIPKLDIPFMVYTQEIDSNIFISELCHYNIQSINRLLEDVRYNNIPTERKASKVCEEGLRILKSIRPSVKIVKSTIKKKGVILKNPRMGVEKYKVDMSIIKNNLLKIHPEYITIVK
jgi:hypothetical protein